MANETYALDRLISLIRANADEPAIRAKYSDAALIQRIEQSCRQIVTKANSVSDNPILVRHSISVAAGSDIFVLPPNVESVRRIAKINATTGIPEWSIEPRTDLHWCGPGIRVEGRIIRFDPRWSGDSSCLEVLYVPNGDFRLHYGTAATVTANTVIFPSSPQTGVLDMRENCYVGAVLRVVTSDQGLIQERNVVAYDVTAHQAWVEPDFVPVPAHATYEVMPLYLPALEYVIAWHVATEILTDPKRYQLAKMKYQDALRDLRTSLRRTNGMTGTYFVQRETEGVSV